MSHLLLLGMGGSSLFPEVLAATFGKQPGYPELPRPGLHRSGPDPPLRIPDRPVPNPSLSFPASPGGTLEPNILKEYFFERVKQSWVSLKPEGWFVAITDPGSRLQEKAATEGFRSIFLGKQAVGGRYSALSNFGRVPAALMGLDVGRVHPTHPPHWCRPAPLRFPRPGIPGWFWVSSCHPGQGRQGQASL